jgi:hypothetical protein
MFQRPNPVSRQDPMANGHPGKFGNLISGEEAQAWGSFSGHNEGAAKRQVHRGEGAPRALCGETRTPRDHRARGSHESGSRSQGFIFQQSIGGLPISPSNFQREEVSASFGSGWMYCASRRCWESYWNYRRWGTTK